jgi:hypothetical protein
MKGNQIILTLLGETIIAYEIEFGKKKLEERAHMEDLDIDGNIVLEINGIWSENTYLIHMIH